ncbi:Prolyl 3,4-dihydroxylase TPA1 [Cyphellophora attinorum]|uniref:uS12 prolyl 3,4-dihydroxylase n=1 Tax=Cyphellophora attinorum TaxID=1664694 RepID=A0A0N0NPX2_9EURO|nr:Prolyl 3,4-dihydroxylase TPA1 [Phialophora attinorum]KPI43228.1 Prolyl 3,4-dihydroxylase TPA1 [Phialophora attinorum]
MSQKRKADPSLSSPPPKKRNTDQTNSIHSAFTADLFDDDTVASYRQSYSQSGPYPHAVVPKLIEDALLRNVRTEINDHIHFTLKETDIYRIHQSGDLANLSGLDSEALRHLPSLVRLRDALYSPDFREWVSNVTGAGLLSGQKTDMAVNVYTPGSYLLCHDDVIGSRRVSYILYLTDPDKPWRAEWGGGLRLFPTEVKQNNSGEDIKVPLAEHTLNIPPSFGQLSFFTVLPGESYHDVEEVYHPPHGQDIKAEDGGRIRMAISGWYHIPQAGEEGYEEGLEQAQAQKSSLTQLKSAANELDEPRIIYKHYDEARSVVNSSATAIEVDPGDDTDTDNDILTEQDLTFLLRYLSPSFLTPGELEKFSEFFAETSILELERFFCEGFANELKAYVENADQSDSSWKIARPPHKHRFAYLQADEMLHSDSSPVARILTDLIHSHAFKKWLALAIGMKPAALLRQDVQARRFRRGKDYALASTYTGEQPQLEFTISMTPSTGWERDDEAEEPLAASTNGAKNNGNHTSSSTEAQVSTSSLPEYGGEEVYMAGDDDDDDDEMTAEAREANANKPLPQVGRKSVDPAVYKSAGDDEADSILFTNVPSWNKFSIVLRDKGTLRFVKYVSQAAKGDRWDIKGMIELADDAFDDEGGDNAAEEDNDMDENEEDAYAGDEDGGDSKED